jgi:hypothetical protein
LPLQEWRRIDEALQAISIAYFDELIVRSMARKRFIALCECRVLRGSGGDVLSGASRWQRANRP